MELWIWMQLQDLVQKWWHDKNQQCSASLNEFFNTHKAASNWTSMKNDKYLEFQYGNEGGYATGDFSKGLLIPKWTVP